MPNHTSTQTYRFGTSTYAISFASTANKLAAQATSAATGANLAKNIVTTARLMANQESANYSRSGTPCSQNPRITGNQYPGISPLAWLKGKSKCNIFAGEILYRSGYEAPTYKMADGSLHYVNAEVLPKMTRHFTLITDLRKVIAGDLLVIDKTSQQGENGAHVEIVTEVSSSQRRLITIGAHDNGIREKNNSALLPARGTNLTPTKIVENSFQLYFLRPILRR